MGSRNDRRRKRSFFHNRGRRKISQFFSWKKDVQSEVEKGNYPFGSVEKETIGGR